MNGRIEYRLTLFAVLTAMMLVMGCITNGDDDDAVEPGEMKTVTKDLVLGSATEVEVNLKLGNGALKVTSDAQKLMEGTFRFNIEQWKPEITYGERGNAWNLSVIMPNESLKVKSGAENDWDVKLGEDVPMSMVVIVGAGSADCKLGGLNLTALTMTVGAGNLDLDLTGAWERNLTISLNTGAGDIDLRVPAGVGVSVTALLGVGSITAEGFTQSGSAYVNAAHATAQVVLTINANAGVGDVEVVEVG